MATWMGLLGKAALATVKAAPAVGQAAFGVAYGAKTLVDTFGSPSGKNTDVERERKHNIYELDPIAVSIIDEIMEASGLVTSENTKHRIQDGDHYWPRTDKLLLVKRRTLPKNDIQETPRAYKMSADKYEHVDMFLERFRAAMLARNMGYKLTCKQEVGVQVFPIDCRTQDDHSPIQKAVCEYLFESFKTVGRCTALLHGPTRTGKSDTGLYLQEMMKENGIHARVVQGFDPTLGHFNLHRHVFQFSPTEQFPLIVIINEFDTVVEKCLEPKVFNDTSYAHSKATLTEFLDDVNKAANVITIYTTNESIDALRSIDNGVFVRSGRMDRCVCFPADKSAPERPLTVVQEHIRHAEYLKRRANPSPKISAGDSEYIRKWMLVVPPYCMWSDKRRETALHNATALSIRDKIGVHVPYTYCHISRMCNDGRNVSMKLARKSDFLFELEDLVCCHDRGKRSVSEVRTVGEICAIMRRECPYVPDSQDASLNSWWNAQCEWTLTISGAWRCMIEWMFKWHMEYRMVAMYMIGHIIPYY